MDQWTTDPRAMTVALMCKHIANNQQQHILLRYEHFELVYIVNYSCVALFCSNENKLISTLILFHIY